MTRDEMVRLKPGDLVRHKASASAMTVREHWGDRVVVERRVELSNPMEWDRVAPNGRVLGPEE